MELYPWSFDSIHFHSYDDVIILYSILKNWLSGGGIAHLLGKTKMRPAHPKKTGSTQTSPILKIFSSGMIECNFIYWDSGITGLVQLNKPWIKSPSVQRIIYLEASFLLLQRPKNFHLFLSF
jgi:hypothetical protein